MFLGYLSCSKVVEFHDHRGTKGPAGGLFFFTGRHISHVHSVFALDNTTYYCSLCLFELDVDTQNLQYLK